MSAPAPRPEPPPVRLETERLVLRRLGPQDLEAFLDYRNDPEVARYQSWESFGRADAETMFREQQAVRPGEPGRWLQLAIERRDQPGLLGDCGFCLRNLPTEGARYAEIGFSLSPGHQGRGYATEAVAAIVDFLFRDLGVERVVAITDSRNTRSQALLRRLGLEREAVIHVWFKGAPAEEYRFALDRQSWLARSGRRPETPS